MRKLLVFVFVCVALYSNAQVICAGSSATIVATSTLTNPSYTLNPGNFSPITNTNTNVQYFVVSPNVTTSYTILSSGISTGTTVVTNSVVNQVTVNPQPTSVPSLTQASCTNSVNTLNLNITFNPSTPAPSYTITWAPIPGNLSSPTQQTVTGLTPGPGAATIVAIGGCSTVANFTVLAQPAPALFTVIPYGGTQYITCVQDTVKMYTTNSALTYTWSGSAFTPIQSDTIYLDATKLGTLTVTGQNTVSGCTTTYTFSLIQSILTPTSTLSTNLINITCTQTLAPTLTVTGSPSVNVTHFIYAPPPQGGTFSATSYTTIYNPGFPGTYTYVLRNDLNGCTTTKTFTVTSNDNYPTYSITSPNNYTLGCFAKSTGSIVIVNAQTTPIPGGAVTYTIIGPPTSTTIPTGSLSTNSNYSVNVPGTWTVIVKDNTNNCETRTQVSILQNTFTPKISAIVPYPILSCYNPSMVIQGVSDTLGVSFNWSFIPSGGGPNNVNGYSITALTILPVTATVANIYTLTVTDNNNTCKTSSTIPVYQNLFPPTTSISALSAAAITCGTPTLVLTNQSKSTIPPVFPTPSFVTAYLWEGPSPQEDLQLSSTYTAATTGIYTLTGKDLNNGCTSIGTFSVGDNRIFPVINPNPNNASYTIDCGSAGVTLAPSYIGSPLSYKWIAPTGAGSVGIGTNATFLVGFPGIFTVIATNTVNQCSKSATVQAFVGVLTATFDASTESGYAPLSVSFTNTSFSSNGTNSITASWNFANAAMTGSTTTGGTFVPGPISSTISPTVIYTQPGTYTVTMYATKGACLDTASKVIVVDIPSVLEIPNIFSPNGDGVNDLFFLKGTNLSEIRMTIFDRWGHVVYDLNSSTGNVSWDGKNQQGMESAAGVYFYTVKSTGRDGTSYDKKGTLTLVK